MIVCGHEDDIKKFTVIFEDKDERLWKAMIERYGSGPMNLFEAGLAMTIGNGLYNPRFKAIVRLVVEHLRYNFSIPKLVACNRETLNTICTILEVEDLDALDELLKGD